MTNLCRVSRKKTKAIKVGFGKDKGINMGPVINVKARERIMELIDDAVSKGAKSLLEEYRKVCLKEQAI